MKVSPRYDGPPLIAVDGAPGDQLEPLVRQRRRIETMLAGLDDEQWHAPTRCDSWDVQDVIAHLNGVNKFWEASIRAGLAGTPTRILVGFDPVAVPAALVGAVRSMPSSEVYDEFVAGNDSLFGLLAELDDDGWQTLAEAPPGHIPVRLLASHALWDSWVHERDIALPMGITPPEEADEVVSSLRYAAALSPGFLVTTGDAPVGVFAVAATDPGAAFTIEVGNEVVIRTAPAPKGAPLLHGDAVALTEALSIRAPLPPDTPAEWRDLLRGLEAAFDAPTVA